MAQATAVRQAKGMFDKLVNMQINRPPLPPSSVSNFAVAALPMGKVLMADGKTKLSSSGKKMDKARKIDRESLAPIGGKNRAAATIGDLLLQISLPPGQITPGGNKAFALANYLSGILRPKLPTTPGIGAPALLPDHKNVSRFYKPSAIANLPSITKSVESTFESPLSKSRTFLENTAKIQKDLAERFLSQFNRGERGAYAAIGGRGGSPLTAGYKTSEYILPTPDSATSVAVKAQSPTYNAEYIK